MIHKMINVYLHKVQVFFLYVFFFLNIVQICTNVAMYTLYPHPKPPTVFKRYFNSDIQLFLHGFSVNTSSDVI